MGCSVLSFIFTSHMHTFWFWAALTYSILCIIPYFSFFVTSYVSSPLSCSTSNYTTCQAFLYLDNNTTPLPQTAQLLHISTHNITAFNATSHDYVASVPCSCQTVFNTSGFFYAFTYTWQSSDVGSTATAVCNSRFHGLCFTRGDYGFNLSAGNEVRFALGCGCPVSGYSHVISYRIQPGDSLSFLDYDMFDTTENAMEQLNDITNPNLIIESQVLFVPTNQNPPSATAPPPSKPSPSHAPPNVTAPQPSISPGKKKKGVEVLKYVLPATLALTIVAGAFTGMFILKHHKKASIPKKGCHHIHNKALVCESCISEEGISGDLKLYSLNDLQSATNNFSESCKLGQGGFGKVYKGIFPDGSLVAIKTRKIVDTFSKKQFVNEVNLLSKLHHSNLVHLLGVCLEGGSVILVYEYIPNGNLAQHLVGNFLPHIHLNWHTRFRIALQIAEALHYIHSDFMQSTATVPGPVYHRDIKPANILLDENLNAKIGDFGLSRLVVEDSSNIFTNAVGTMGYGDPQYFQFEHLTDKSDVYSFGVILMELITAKKHIDSERDSEVIHIGAYSLDMMKQGKFEEIIDPQLKSDETSWGNESVRRSIWSSAKLAWRCMRFERVKRPSMEKVVEELRRIKRKMELQQMAKSLTGKERNMEELCIDLYPHTGRGLVESESYGSDVESLCLSSQS